MTSKYFFKPFISIPVAPIITGIITYFKYHIRYISIHKLLYFLNTGMYITVKHNKLLINYQ
jgi:hypothetical protein